MISSNNKNRVDSQQFFYINLILGVFFVIYFVLGRPKSRLPTKLNLKAGESDNKNRNDIAKNILQQKEASLQIEPKVKILEPESNSDAVKTKSTKNLSLFFMYNGHDWEAHQVLGIPQGASLEVATKAYQEMIKESDPSSFEFLESAYNCIFQQRRKDRL